MVDSRINAVAKVGTYSTFPKWGLAPLNTITSDLVAFLLNKKRQTIHVPVFYDGVLFVLIFESRNVHTVRLTSIGYRVAEYRHYR